MALPLPNRLAACGAALALLTACAGGYQSPSEADLAARAAAGETLTAASGSDAIGVVKRALLADPDIRTEASLIAASADQIRIERAEKFPSLSASAGAGAGKAGTGDPAIGLTGRQVLWDGGAIDRKVKRADIDLQRRYQSFQVAVDGAIAGTLTAYAEVAAFAEMRKVRQDQQKAVNDLSQLILQRVEMGAIPKQDQLEVSNRIERAEYDLLDAGFRLDEARDRLRRLSGSEQAGKLPSALSACKPSGLVPDKVILARLAVLDARLALADAKRSAYPRVSLTVPGTLELGTGGVSSGVNLGVDTTFLRGGAVKAAIARAENQQRAADAALAAAERDARLDEVSLARRIATLGQKQAMLRRQIALQTETRDLYRSQYIDLGTRELTDLLDAETTLADRRIELIETGLDLMKAQIDCATAGGSLRKTLGLEGSVLHGFPL